MDTKQIALVKYSWGLLSTLDPGILNRLFCQYLFEKIPALQSRIEEQPVKLMNMMGHIINRLDQPDAVINKISNFAQRRLKDNLQPGHYLFAGNALLWALANGLKENWTEELRAAWAGCYTSISNAIMEATCAAEMA